MRRAHIVLAATLAASLIPQSAMAGTGIATATIDGLTFTLIDLDLTDDITPSLTFVEASSTPTLYSAVGHLPAPPAPAENAYQRNYIDLTPDAPLSSGTASASVHGASATAGSTASSLSARAEASAVMGTRSSAVVVAEPAGLGRTFELSAKTRLLIQGSYSLEASLIGSLSKNEVASSQLSFIAQLGSATESFHDGILLTGAQPKSESRTGQFSYAFNNDTASVSQGALLNLNAYTYVAVGAVPEADAGWLALAGLGVAGGLMARRRAQTKVG